MKNGCAKGLGIRIAKEVQSNGLATDAYMTLFNFAFNELRLHRIETSAFDDNFASLKFHEKQGCKREGIKREAAFKNGGYKNIVTLGCLKEDFVPYLNTIVPILIKTASQEVELPNEEELSEYFDEMDDVKIIEL